MAVKNLVRSNIVSQVPYFITFQFEEDTVKPTIKLVEMWRYYNNQTTQIPLYGATNINCSFNGAWCGWEYKKITLTEAPTQTNQEALVFTTDDALFEAGSYYQHEDGEIILVEKVESHVVYARRKLFDTKVTTIASGDKFYQLNTIVLNSPDDGGTTTKKYVAGIATVWANPFVNPSSTGYYKA